MGYVLESKCSLRNANPAVCFQVHVSRSRGGQDHTPARRAKRCKSCPLPFTLQIIQFIHCITPHMTLTSAGPKEVGALPWQPGGDDKRGAVSDGEERGDGRHEEDIRQHKTCPQIQVPLMTGHAFREQLSTLFTWVVFNGFIG